MKTGHGPWLSFLYQSFGSVETFLLQLKTWMSQHPREVVVVHFGRVDRFNETYSQLQAVLGREFPNNEGLNTQFQETGSWPSLGLAVAQSRTLFLMVRIKESEAALSEEGPKPFIKVKKVTQPGQIKAALPSGWASVTSTYSQWIGRRCDTVVSNARTLCRALDADFVKVAAYGALGGGHLCLDRLSRQCNPRIPDILAQCLESQPWVNFLFADYPNYPARSSQTLPEIAEQENERKTYMSL